MSLDLLINSLTKYNRFERETSLLYWYPKVRSLVPIPKTIVIKLSERELVELIKAFLEANGDDRFKARKDVLERFVGRVSVAVNEVGGYPAFYRSDMLSGKHDYLNTCYLPSESRILPHTIAIIEKHFEGIEPIPLSAFVVRELLKPDYGFKAFGGLPIARERRIFIRDHKVEAIYPYWPEDAIHFGLETREYAKTNWAEILEKLNNETPEEEVLLGYAKKIAEVMDGYWSVDFLYDRERGWFLIDMARGEVSWRPDEEKST